MAMSNNIPTDLTVIHISYSLQVGVTPTRVSISARGKRTQRARTSKSLSSRTGGKRAYLLRPNAAPSVLQPFARNRLFFRLQLPILTYSLKYSRKPFRQRKLSFNNGSFDPVFSERSATTPLLTRGLLPRCMLPLGSLRKILFPRYLISRCDFFTINSAADLPLLRRTGIKVVRNWYYWWMT
jgi:hypothetical protein